MRGKEIFNMSEVFNNNEFTSEPSQQSSNSYPYSFEQPFDAQQQPFAAQPQPSAPVPEQKKKSGKAGKIVALLLACALVGGGSGFGAAALMQKNAAAQPQSTTQASSDASVMLEAKRQAAALQVASVDTGKVLTPSEVYAQNVNSTVGITTSITTNYWGFQTTSAAAGSGFILTEDGYILTNYHVVENSNSITVAMYSGDTYDATLIGYDESNDVAVLKVDAEGLSPVVLGDSDNLNVGDSVVAIGNPLGELTFSMSSGIVSCVNRAINVEGTPFNMIQVDASINPGNSGGPLMNLYGEVVGIVSAKYSTYSSTTVEGLGFAIPIDDVKSIITDIMENGAVTGKAYMAVTVGTMNSQMAAQYSIDIDQGVFVYSVVKGGAGDKAGLRLGDVITKMGDTTLTSRQDLSAALKSYRSGDTATLTVFRDGSYITTDITFDQQPQITGTDTEEDTSSQGGNNGGYSGQIPENWQEFYNYFFGNRG